MPGGWSILGMRFSRLPRYAVAACARTRFLVSLGAIRNRWRRGPPSCCSSCSPGWSSWSGRNDPAALAVALAAYSALTFFGMALFGRQTWLARGEMFTLVFGTFARFGPLAAIPQRPGIRVRMPAAGLLAEAPATFSMVALVVALLATVTFDGLLETPLWA